MGQLTKIYIGCGMLIKNQKLPWKYLTMPLKKKIFKSKLWQCFDIRIFKLYMVMKFFSCIVFSSLCAVHHQLLKRNQFHPLRHFHFRILWIHLIIFFESVVSNISTDWKLPGVNCLIDCPFVGDLLYVPVGAGFLELLPPPASPFVANICFSRWRRR